jgi:hypothetical protein
MSGRVATLIGGEGVGVQPPLSSWIGLKTRDNRQKL